MPSIRICHHNTQGLYNDFLILEAALKSNFTITHVVYSEISLLKNENIENTELCDINIFLEHIYENFIVYGKRNILFPNPEWLNKRDTQLISKLDLICCKTKHCYNILKAQFSNQKISYTGFTSLDKYNENIAKKHDYFLHLKGVSKYKNSQVLVDTWLKHPEWPTLVVVHHGDIERNGTLHFNIPFKVSSNIIVYQTKLENKALESIMNQCGVHICCSFSEGFGHYINEARSTGAFLITTDGNPMKEFLKNEKSGLLIPFSKKIKLNYGEGFYIEGNDIERKINSIIHSPGKLILKNGFENRSLYIKERELFFTNIQREIKNLK